MRRWFRMAVSCPSSLADFAILAQFTDVANGSDSSTYGAEIAQTRARRVQMLWEITQALIAIGVTGTTLYVATILALRQDGGDVAQLLLSNAFFLIVGYYFGRSRMSGSRSTDTSQAETSPAK